MLCRCVRKCYLDNRLYRTGQEEEFPSCPAWFLPVEVQGAQGAEKPQETAAEEPKQSPKPRARRKKN